MSVSFNPNSTTVIPPGLGGVPPAETSSPSQVSSPSLIIQPNQSGIQTIQFAHQIETPMLSPNDLQMTEALQALDSLGVNSSQLQIAMATNNMMSSFMVASELTEIIAEMSEEDFAKHKTALEGAFAKIEQSAQGATETFAQMINSGKYPDASEFLKLMLEISNDLRQGASAARQASVEGQYQTTLLQASNMVKIAEERYAATMKEIEAKKAEAIADIVGGFASIGTSFLGSKFAKTETGQAAWNQGAGSLNQIAKGFAGIATAKMRSDAATHTLKADLLEAANKRLDAVLKLQQNAEQVTSEIADIAKALRDMVLKLHQDMMSAQNQIIQRSNI